MLSHQLRVLLHSFGERTEDDASLLQLLFISSRNRDGIEDSVNGNIRKLLLLLKRNAKLLECAKKLWINFVHARLLSLLLWRAVVDDLLIVDFRVLDVRPVARLRHGQPVAIGFQAERKHPLRLVLLRRDEPNRILVQSSWNDIGFDVGHETVLVFFISE